MKTMVSKWDFQDAFNAIRPNNFTYDGLEALYGYLEDYEESCGVEFVAISILSTICICILGYGAIRRVK